MDPRELVGLAGVPVIVALVELVKRSWPGLESGWYPMVTMVIAMGLNLALGWHLGTDLFLAWITGVVSGLAASGLYSQARAIGGG